MRSRLRHVTDDDIEEAVQHNLAILREHWAEQGYGLDGDHDADDDLRERVERIEEHLGIKKKLTA